MAMIRKCDRCGKVYEHYEGQLHNYPFGVNAIRYMYVGKYDIAYAPRKEPIDLCPKCFESFNEWMKEKE